jgi:phosphoribosylanthranilate isomerase
MTEVKICGMRSREDLEAASNADYVGFILETLSPRCLDLETARELMGLARPRKVLVSTCRDPQVLEKLCRELQPDVLQAHSFISVMDLNRLRQDLDVEIWSLYAIEDPLDSMRLKVLSTIADKIHLDTPNVQGGGMGMTHDWELSKRVRSVIAPQGVVLAGGLTPENVAVAIDIVHPDVVDVSSGVEWKDGKSADLINKFIEEAKRV